jgi:hypothetical protein
MSDIFPKWTNRLPSRIIAGALLLGASTVGGIWYYCTNEYTDVGYQPLQPVAFSHAIHVGQVGVDCRYCHNGVEKAWYSNIPTASTCMNCHSQILATDPRLALVRESYATGKPIPWVQIHKMPDFVYFNHSVHVNRGVSCVECHGQINQMDEVRQAKPLSMSFCLNCHRDPAARLRPPEKITDLDWKWSDDPKVAAQLQRTHGQEFVTNWKVESLQNCSACHR